MAPTRFRPLNASTAVFVLLSAMCSARAPAAPSLPEPGLYRVEVRIALPNVQDVAAPLILTQCVTDADLFVIPPDVARRFYCLDPRFAVFIRDLLVQHLTADRASVTAN